MERFSEEILKEEAGENKSLIGSPPLSLDLFPPVDWARALEDKISTTVHRSHFSS